MDVTKTCVGRLCMRIFIHVDCSWLFVCFARFVVFLMGSALHISHWQQIVEERTLLVVLVTILVGVVELIVQTIPNNSFGEIDD